MSAITGICDLRAIAGSASASSWLGHGHPDDLAAGRGQLGDLLQRGVDVGGQRRGHRLHRDRRVAADRHRVPMRVLRGSVRPRSAQRAAAAAAGMPR